jgi:hypothetical protein
MLKPLRKSTVWLAGATMLFSGAMLAAEGVSAKAGGNRGSGASAGTHGAEVSASTHGAEVSASTHGAEVSASTHGAEVSASTHGANISANAHGAETSAGTGESGVPAKVGDADGGGSSVAVNSGSGDGPSAEAGRSAGAVVGGKGVSGGPAAIGPSPRVAVTSRALAKGATPTSASAMLTLPIRLEPRRPCAVQGDVGCQSPSSREVALLPVESVHSAIITACFNELRLAAIPYNPVSVHAVRAGHVRRTEDGGQIAPLWVRIVYDRQGGFETRRATVACRVDARGAVVSLV